MLIGSLPIDLYVPRCDGSGKYHSYKEDAF